MSKTVYKKEGIKMIMIIEAVLVGVAVSTFIFGMTGFSVFMNKMEEADNIKQGLKLLAFAILSLLSCCAVIYVLMEVTEIIRKIIW